MTEFSAAAQLDVQLDSRSVRSAREELEEELTTGPIQVEVESSRPNRTGSASRGLSSSSDGMSGNNRPGSLLKDQEKTLLNIEGHWKRNLELNEERNDLLLQLLSDNEKGNMTRTGRMGRMGGGLIGGGMLALGLGASSLGEFLDFDVPEFDIEAPDLPPLEAPDIPPVPAPDIDPLEVPDIGPLEIPNIDPLEVPDIDPLEVPDIDPLEVPDIDPLEVPEIPPLEVPEISHPDWMWPEIPQPDWIPIPPPEMPERPGSPSPTPTPAPDGTPTPPPGRPSGGGKGFNLPEINAPEINVPDVSPKEALAAGAATGAGAAGWVAQKGGSISKSVPKAVPKGGGVGFPAPSIQFGQQIDRASRVQEDERTPVDDFFAGIGENLGGGSSIQAASVTPEMDSSMVKEAVEAQLPEPRVDLKVNPNINLDGKALQRDLEDQVNKAVDDAKRETMREIEKVKRAFD